MDGPHSEITNGQWKRQSAGIGIVTLIAAPLIIAGTGYALILPAFGPDKSTPASRYHDASLDIDTDPPQPWIARTPQEWLELERRREQKEVQP